MARTVRAGQKAVSIPEAKKGLRTRVREELKRMSPDERERESAAACALLKMQSVWKEAQSVLLFAPLAEELDIWVLLNEVMSAGKVAALPRFKKETGAYAACRIQDMAADLFAGRFGIREPNESCLEITDRFDLLLVPGVAFDLKGGRLGRGTGFYDRLLSTLSGPKCGVAFDQQIVEGVVLERHDYKMDYLLTPTRWVKI